MKRYYFIVRFVPKYSDHELLSGRCLFVLHGFMYRNDTRIIGVTFPEWSGSGVGSLIGFVSQNQKLLIELAQQPYFTSMSDEGFFDISDVELVPDGLPEIRFLRNQRIAKIFQGEKRRRLERLRKRAESRGEVFKPSKTACRTIREYKRILMDSRSSGNRFYLHVQRQENVMDISCRYNSYGLANQERIEGTVPDLSRLLPIF